MRYISFLSLSIVLAACSFADADTDDQSTSSSTNSRSSVQSSQQGSFDSSDSSPIGDFDPLASITATNLPSEKYLDVPFTPQAPDANWDPPFDEACEEASILMAEYYLRGSSFTADSAASEIEKMAAYEAQVGIPIDATSEQTASVARKYLKRDAVVYTGNQVTVENIKALIAAGHPVVIPAAGQLLGNPYFSGDGPPYHMLIITGYDGDTFITNDPGTKRGAGYEYDAEHLVSIIHDWNGSKDTIMSGQKAMIVITE